MALGVSTFRILGHHGKNKACLSAIKCDDRPRFLVVGLNGNINSRCVSQNATASSATRLSSLKRGTGGRSSFSGVVATVFGASGQLGRDVVNKLGKVGSQVIVPYRGDHYDVMDLKLAGDLGQILYFPYNLKDENSIRKAMKYSNVVVNLIGKDFETDGFKFEDVHVTGARHIARIAKELGIQKLVHVSALNAAEKPEPVILKNGSGFLASKWRGEMAVLNEFPEAIVFRPSDIWGHADRFLLYYGGLWRQQNRNYPFHNRGEGIFKQPVYCSDVALGIVNAIFDESTMGQTYEIVGPNRYELSEMVDWMMRVMRKTELDWGYKRTNLKYSPLFKLKIALVQTFFRKYPKLSFERLEREHVSDELSIPRLPGLEELGVQATDLGEKAPYYLKMFRAHGYYIEDFGEFEPPLPPKLANYY